MPRKSRKSRAKRIRYKAQSGLKPTVVKEVHQQPQLLSIVSKQAPVAKSPVTIGGQADRLRHVPQELRRILIIAAALLVLLVVLSLLLR